MAISRRITDVTQEAHHSVPTATDLNRIRTVDRRGDFIGHTVVISKSGKNQELNK